MPGRDGFAWGITVGGRSKVAKFYLFHNKVSWMRRQAAAEKARRNV